METETTTEKVARGVALLDARQPEWWLRIDLDDLDVGDASRCILSQLYGSYTYGLDQLGLDSSAYLRLGATHAAGIPYGFDPSHTEYEETQQVWEKVITDRINAG